MKYSENIDRPADIALTHIATIGFLGHIPVAPGTAGSICALLLFLLTNLSLSAHFSVIIIGTLVGTYASAVAERRLKEKDSRKIIIDEFIGFYVSVFYLPKTYGLAISAFILFRFFDILKPLYISKLEKTLSNGFSVMADDILAGFYTNMILQIWLLFFQI